MSVSVSALVDIVLGLLFIALAIPLILRKVAMNGFYGVRLPAAYRSDANWYDLNHFGGWCLVAAGAVSILVGVVAALWIPRTEAQAFAYQIAPAVLVLLSLIPIGVRAARLP